MEETQFVRLYPRAPDCGQSPKLITTGEGGDGDRPLLSAQVLRRPTTEPYIQHITAA